MELRAGVRLDRYTLVLPLGEGGQAVVWKVIDPLEGGAVRALKVFHLAGSNPHVAERARREAKASAGLQHPGLLPCRTYLEDPAAEIAALVFDYVRGRSLADALTEPRMTPEHRRCAVRQIAETLAHVHERGVIHRDVKPDNVLVTDAFWDSPGEPGTLKLVDFGIAAPAGNPNPLTREGGVVGTAPYLPPELLDTQGLFGAGTDFQRDVFAFGVLAWEVLVGKHPTGLALDASRDAFAGIYLSARAGKRPWPPEAGLSTELRVAASCLALSPTDRPESAVVISKLLGGESVGSSTRSRAPEYSSRRAATVTHETPTMGVANESGRSSTEPVQVSMPVPPFDRAAPNRVSRAPSRADRLVAPPLASVQGAPARRGGVQWLLAAGLIAGGALFVGVYLLMSQPSVPSPFTPTTLQPTVTPHPTLTVTPTLTPKPPDPIPSKPEEICCEKGKDTCLSGRPCKSGTCTSVHVSEQRSFRLRVSGGFLLSGAQKDEIQQKWSSSIICLKNGRTSEESCASSKTIMAKGSDPSNRILATPEDMQKGRIDIRVINGSTTLAHEVGYAYPSGYSTTDLCKSVTLRLHDYISFTGKIYLYLDDF